MNEVLVVYQALIKTFLSMPVFAQRKESPKTVTYM